MVNQPRRRSGNPTSDTDIERVRELVAAIPPGRVTTYGDIAAAAGLSTARTVGWIMRTDSADLPWHRVLRADGTPAPHLAHHQLDRLAAEGCLIADGRVDLHSARFCFAPMATHTDCTSSVQFGSNDAENRYPTISTSPPATAPIRNYDRQP